MKRPSWLILLLSYGVAGGLGCDDEDVLLTEIAVTGQVRSHPLNSQAAAAAGNPEGAAPLQVSVVSVLDLAEAVILKGSPSTADDDVLSQDRVRDVDEECSVPDEPGCGFELPFTDVGSVYLGLIMRVANAHEHDTVWATTTTYSAPQADVLQARNVNEGTLRDVEAYVLTREVVEGFVVPVTGLTTAQLYARGFIIGTVLSRQSDSPPQPVASVFARTNVEDFQVFYPNDALNGINALGTAQHGLFFAVPPAPKPGEHPRASSMSFWKISGSREGLTWPRAMAVTSTHAVHVLTVAASDD